LPFIPVLRRFVAHRRISRLHNHTEKDNEPMKALLAALFAGVLALASPSFAAQAEQVLVAQAKTELIDINRAKAEELMTLKGIGEARAKAIIESPRLL